MKERKRLFQKVFLNTGLHTTGLSCDSGSIGRARGALKPFLQTHSKGLFIQTEDLDYGIDHVFSF